MALHIINRANCLCSGSLLARILPYERLSSAAEAAIASERDVPFFNDTNKPNISIKSFRTTENDPRNHGVQHLARMYTVPPQIAQKVLSPLPKKFSRLSHTFTETCIMVRKPFLEIVDHIKCLDFSKPTVRFVVYGPTGYGKTLTLSHVLHYGFNSGYLLIHIPWVNTFIRSCKDASPSETKPGMLDVPIDASNWLLHFKTQNEELLDKLNLVTTKSYEWGLRETTPQGSPISDLIEFGIARSKYACDVVDVLLRELKMFSTLGRFKTMVVIDGVNGLFSPFIITMRDRVKHFSKCSLAQPFLSMVSYDWCNAVVVVSVDRNSHHDPFNTQSHLPFHILGKQGWEHLDPFIPIEVDRYDEAEVNSALDYYIDRQWLQHPEAKTDSGRAELKVLCGNIPIQLRDMCAPL